MENDKNQDHMIESWLFSQMNEEKPCIHITLYDVGLLAESLYACEVGQIVLYKDLPFHLSDQDTFVWPDLRKPPGIFKRALVNVHEWNGSVTATCGWVRKS